MSYSTVASFTLPNCEKCCANSMSPTVHGRFLTRIFDLNSLTDGALCSMRMLVTKCLIIFAGPIAIYWFRANEFRGRSSNCRRYTIYPRISNWRSNTADSTFAINDRWTNRTSDLDMWTEIWWAPNCYRLRSAETTPSPGYPRKHWDRRNNRLQWCSPMGQCRIPISIGCPTSDR